MTWESGPPACCTCFLWPCFSSILDVPLAPYHALTWWAWQKPACDGQLWLQGHLLSRDAQFLLRPISMLRTHFWMSCGSLLPMAWPCYRTLRVYLVILLSELVINSHDCSAYHRYNCPIESPRLNSPHNKAKSTKACTCYRAFTCSGSHWKLSPGIWITAIFPSSEFPLRSL